MSKYSKWRKAKCQHVWYLIESMQRVTVILPIKSNLVGHFMTNTYILWRLINILFIASFTHSISDNLQFVSHFLNCSYLVFFLFSYTLKRIGHIINKSNLTSLYYSREKLITTNRSKCKQKDWCSIMPFQTVEQTKDSL